MSETGIPFGVERKSTVLPEAREPHTYCCTNCGDHLTAGEVDGYDAHIIIVEDGRGGIEQAQCGPVERLEEAPQLAAEHMQRTGCEVCPYLKAEWRKYQEAERRYYEGEAEAARLREGGG